MVALGGRDDSISMTYIACAGAVRGMISLHSTWDRASRWRVRDGRAYIAARNETERLQILDLIQERTPPESLAAHPYEVAECRRNQIRTRGFYANFAAGSLMLNSGRGALSLLRKGTRRMAGVQPWRPPFLSRERPKNELGPRLLEMVQKSGVASGP